MIKLNKMVYERLLAQAQEAKELNLDYLGDSLLSVIGPVPRDGDEEIQISRADLEKEIYKNIWKIALDLISFHDLKAPDIQKLGDNINDISNNLISNLENSLNVEGKPGVLEPKLPGEK